jgi:hypothetical protein
MDQSAQLRAAIKEFERRDAQVIAVLPYPPDEWQLSAGAKTESGAAAFPILADPSVTMVATYGQGRLRRGWVSGNAGAMVIDRDGVIRFHHAAGKDLSKRVVFDRPTPERLLQVVDDLKEKRARVETLKNDKNPGLRKAAAVALDPLGADAKTVVPEFVKALQSDHVDVRLAAVAALWYIAPDAPTAILALGTALNDGDTRVRRLTAEALWMLGRKASSALPTVVEALRDKDAGVRAAAVEALWVIGPDAKAVVMALAGSLKDDDPVAARAVAFALARIGKGATEAPQAVLEMLQHEQARARQFAATALGHLEKSAQPDPKVVAALIRALKDTDAQVRRAGAEALKTLDPEAAKKAGVR